MKLSETRYARPVTRRPGTDPRAALASLTSGARARRINVGKAVGTFVPGLAQAAFEKYGFSTVALLTDWGAIAGPALAAHTKPERLKWPRNVSIGGDVEAGCEGRPGATLMLSVDPARALEVQYGTGQLIERINSYFGYRAVQEIRLLQNPSLAKAVPAAAKSHAVLPKVAALQPGRGQDAGPAAATPESGETARGVAVRHEALRASLERLQAGITGR